MPQKQPRRKWLRLNDGSCVRLKSDRTNHVWSGIEVLYIDPGSPWENGYIELFNGKLRDELLNCEIFDALFEAKTFVDLMKDRI